LTPEHEVLEPEYVDAPKSVKWANMITFMLALCAGLAILGLFVWAGVSLGSGKNWDSDVIIFMLILPPIAVWLVLFTAWWVRMAIRRRNTVLEPRKKVKAVASDFQEYRPDLR
jgi:type VI protein secretion system component VasK